MNKKNNTNKIIVVFLLVVLLGLIGWRVWSVHFAPQDNAIAESQQIEEVNVSPLSQHQQELMNDYSQADWDFIKLLSGNLWITNNDTSSLIFDDSTFYTVVNGQKSEPTPYAISALKKSQVSADGETINEYTCSFETDKATYILTLQQSTSDDTLMSLSCDAFKSNAYIRANAAESFEIKGVPEQIYNIIGNDKAHLQDALQSYCTVNYPTVFEATSAAVVNIDYAEGVAEIPFALNNDAKSQVTVVYDMNTKTFSVTTLR